MKKIKKIYIYLSLKGVNYNMVKTNIKLDNYVVLDIENPNTKADSICSIAFIQIKDGNIAERKYFLINPEDRFDSINMKVNKITPNMVKDAITFDVFWKDKKDIIENSIVIGHAIKYDLSVISKTLMKYNISLPTLKVVCTKKLAQKYLNVSHYKLNQICDYLNIDLENHHNALCDTTASFEIFKYINNKYGLDDNDIEDYNYTESRNCSTRMKIVYSDDTKGLQNLKKIIESIMVDNKIELDEINELNEWLDDNTQLIGNYPFDKIYSIVKKVLEDGMISDNEYNELMNAFNDFINPIKEEKTNSSINFQDKIFCLTGTFNSGPKDSIEKQIIEKGGTCGKGVTSSTNYLIVGGFGSDAWKFGNYGGKVQKAMELKEKGKDIVIISEDDFLKQL